MEGSVNQNEKDLMSEQEWRRHVCERFREGKERMDSFDEKLTTNTKLTQTIHDNTSDLVETFKAVKGGFKVLGWFGSLAKWLGGIAAAGAAIVAAYQAWLKMFSK